LLLAAFTNLIECRLGELERHDSKTPLAFACRRDTEWQAPLFPLKDVYLVGLDPHSLVIKAEMLRDFVGDFDCGRVSVWRHVRDSANDYLSGVIFTGLRDKNDGAGSIFSAMHKPGVVIVLPKKIVPDHQTGCRLDHHDLVQQMVKLRRRLAFITSVQLCFEIVAQFVRIGSLSCIVSLQPFILFDIHQHTQRAVMFRDDNRLFCGLLDVGADPRLSSSYISYISYIS